MRILRNSYPNGKMRAITFSYDDGTIYDRRLVDIFNATGLKASFHLNSGLFGQTRHISADEVPYLYTGHEVSVHTLTHPTIALSSNEQIIHEVMGDRANLEALVNYPVRGMSYPNGSFDGRVLSVLRSCGIVCSRTTLATNNFKLPSDFLLWHPTCHHSADLNTLADRFFAPERWKGYGWQLNCFFIWGHSYEFNDHDNWNIIEGFARRVAHDEQTWYATNIEIYDYITALNSLQFTTDERIVHNPSALDVWITVDCEPVKIPAGESVRLS